LITRDEKQGLRVSVLEILETIEERRNKKINEAKRRLLPLRINLN
tara:strand:- start:231 stop:365 length:135 start_codon:yes stop_codon:yes gene_type:complete